jgi:phage repressor protein C with HTH and peptisase S24 domain
MAPVRCNVGMANKRTPAASENDRLYGRALAVIRMRQGIPQQRAAERLGVTTQAWQNYEAGLRKSIFTVDGLSRLATALDVDPGLIEQVKGLLKEGVSEAWMSDGAQPLPTSGSEGKVVFFSRRAEPEVPPAEELAPVYGAVFAGKPGAIAFTPDRPDDWKPVHPNQRGYRDPFYLQVHGDSLSPRFEPGELAPAVRGVWPTRGQVCIIETHDGAMLLKYYERRDAQSVWVRELQPEPREFGVHLADIRAVHAVVGGAVS